MTIKVSRFADVAVLRIVGKLTLEDPLALHQQFLRVLAEGARQFVFDFRRTSYIDSSGAGQVAACLRDLQAAGGGLCFLEKAQKENMDVCFFTNAGEILHQMEVSRYFELEDALTHWKRSP